MAAGLPVRTLLGVAVCLGVLAGGAGALPVEQTGGALFASCTASPSTVVVGENVTLDASNSDAFYVEFDKQGDGTYERTDETDFVVNVSYAEPGTYEPVVRADGEGADTDSCGTVTVESPNERPTASMSVSPNPTTVGESTEFDASASVDPDGEIVEYRWDFDGDETVDETTAGPTTTHAYEQADSYVALLEVVDDDGASGFTSTDVRVDEPPPTAVCSVTPSSVAPGESVTIDATATENADGIDYDLDGDGEYDVFERQTFTYETSYDVEGSYTPRVRVYGAGGTDTAGCGTVSVAENEPPNAALSVSPNPATVGEPVTLDGSASSDPDGFIATYSFDFDGDGVYDENTSAVTEHTYDQPGSYGPRLRVVDNEGATWFTSVDLRVEEATPEPRLTCTVEPTAVGVGEPVTIDSTDSRNVSVVDYDVDGDGTFEELERTTLSITTSYGESGTYAPLVRAHGGDLIAECGTVTVSENRPPEPGLSISPNPATVGETITFDASNAVDPDGTIASYEWDFDGDGTTDETTADPTTTTTIDQAGPYVGRVTVVDDDGARASLSRDYRVEAETRAVCSVDPRTVEPGGTVTIDATNSTGGFVVDYDVDGDGEYDAFERESFTYETSYGEPGTYTPVIRVYGSAEPIVAECPSVTVEAGNEPPTAAFSVDPSGPTTGQNVTFDGSASSDPDGSVVEYRWDFDGDGTVEQTTTDPRVSHTYADAASLVPRLVVVDDDGATGQTSRDLAVEAVADPGPTTTQPDEQEGGAIPWPFLGLGLGGLAGLGGLLWYTLGGGGAATGGSEKPTPKPKPKPKLDEEVTTRYETGVFEIPSSSGTLTVPVGFEPDLILLAATNGARTDTATDRTAGWCQGLAHAAESGITNQCLTVADDAHSTDQATCAVADDLALQLVRHEGAAPPGRVSARVSETTSNGFEVDVAVPGDDPLAGGIRILYQAFRTGSDAEVEVGHFETPTEPGVQTVDLDIDAEHISLSTSAAVSDIDQLWTTDRSVGLTVGNAIADPEGPLAQTVCATSTWPGPGHTTAEACGSDAALSLLYQDADRLAGRTSATVTGLGETLRLRYDRVYNGPHKLGSTARHPVSYLALAGEPIRPAVGAFPMPEPGERLSVDCGFEPELIECYVSAAPLGETIRADASAHPFGWSQGTAIRAGDRLRQYVLHHAVVAEPAAARANEAAVGGQEAAAADGGASSIEIPPAARSADDGRVGLWLVRAPDGTVLGREELGVTATTETGFEATTERLSTDRTVTGDQRPTVLYRAWPVADGASGDAGSNPAGETDMTGDTASHDSSTGGDRTRREQGGTDGR